VLETLCCAVLETLCCAGDAHNVPTCADTYRAPPSGGADAAPSCAHMDHVSLLAEKVFADVDLFRWAAMNLEPRALLSVREVCRGWAAHFTEEFFAALLAAHFPLSKGVPGETSALLYALHARAGERAGWHFRMKLHNSAGETVEKDLRGVDAKDAGSFPAIWEAEATFADQEGLAWTLTFSSAECETLGIARLTLQGIRANIARMRASLLDISLAVLPRRGSDSLRNIILEETVESDADDDRLLQWRCKPADDRWERRLWWKLSLGPDEDERGVCWRFVVDLCRESVPSAHVPVHHDHYYSQTAMLRFLSDGCLDEGGSDEDIEEGSPGEDGEDSEDSDRLALGLGGSLTRNTAVLSASL